MILRKAKGISQEQLALRAEISVSRLRDIEHGRVNSSLDMLESIAKVLEVNILVLFILLWEEATVLELLHSGKRLLPVEQKEAV